MLKFTLKYLIFAPTCFGPIGLKKVGANIRHFSVKFNILFRGADKFLARPGKKQATATEGFEFHVSYL